jgi:hypothetical protein
MTRSSGYRDDELARWLRAGLADARRAQPRPAVWVGLRKRIELANAVLPVPRGFEPAGMRTAAHTAPAERLGVEWMYRISFCLVLLALAFALPVAGPSGWSPRSAGQSAGAYVDALSEPERQIVWRQMELSHAARWPFRLTGGQSTQVAPLLEAFNRDGWLAAPPDRSTTLVPGVSLR